MKCESNSECCTNFCHEETKLCSKPDVEQPDVEQPSKPSTTVTPNPTPSTTKPKEESAPTEPTEVSTIEPTEPTSSPTPPTPKEPDTTRCKCGCEDEDLGNIDR